MPFVSTMEKLSERGEHAVVEFKYGMLHTQRQAKHCKYNPLVQHYFLFFIRSGKHTLASLKNDKWISNQCNPHCLSVQLRYLKHCGTELGFLPLQFRMKARLLSAKQHPQTPNNLRQNITKKSSTKKTHSTCLIRTEETCDIKPGKTKKPFQPSIARNENQTWLFFKYSL